MTFPKNCEEYKIYDNKSKFPSMLLNDSSNAGNFK